MVGSDLSAAGFLRIAKAQIRRACEDRAVRTYIADALRLLTENTAWLSGGSYMRTGLIWDDHSYTEFSDSRSGEEIIDHIRRRMRE